MGKIVEHTDLSLEEPGPRADVDLPQEDIEFRAKLPLAAGEVEVRARISPGSLLSSAIIAVALVSAGCVCASTLFVIGATVWTATASLLLPTAVYLAVSHHRASLG